MKKLLVVAAVLLGLAYTPMVSAQNLQAFTINSFEADYYLAKDDKDVSQLKVVERIEAEFPEYDQNHGIERALPQKYKGKDLNVQITSITRDDGTAWNYSTYAQNDNLIARIGDGGRYVHGAQTYVITYTQRNVITFESDSGGAFDHDEWYWDVNGDEWQQPISSVVARLHLRESLASKISKDTICYTGSYGQSGADCAVERSSDAYGQVITVTSTRSFSAGENLSFVMGFAQSTFQPYKIDPALLALIIAYFAGSFLLPIVITFIIMYRRWSKSGRDPKGRGVIVPQYKPQKGMNPLMADVILNERLQTKAVSASLIDLCVSGYIKMYEVTKKKVLKDKTEYELELMKPCDTLTGEMQEVARLFFGNISKSGVGERVNVNEKSRKLYAKVASLTKTMGNTVAGQGYFVSNPETARRKYAWVSGLIGVICIVGFTVLQPWLISLSISLAVSIVIILLFQRIMPARTQEGVDAKEYLLGLKDYMELAEADRIKFLQGPDTAEKIDVKDTKKLVKLYEQLL
ncbi:DUF2207 domain-containing protein, partial [Candidatus Saccharibacteria bacterium]|nr:DUF2207 domain-containing protein [Candidatus Saccharibacteria bacterium]